MSLGGSGVSIGTVRSLRVKQNKQNNIQVGEGLSPTFYSFRCSRVQNRSLYRFCLDGSVI